MRASLLKLDLAFLRPLISFVAAMVRIGSVSTDGSDASPVGSPDHASSEIQRQPSDDGMINWFEHEHKGDFATSPKYFRVAWVKLITVCIAGLQQQNGAITSNCDFEIEKRLLNW
ncbi:unnamed protein product [Prunus brigantina]